jgi:hypothetical protein
MTVLALIIWLTVSGEISGVTIVDSVEDTTDCIETTKRAMAANEASIKARVAAGLKPSVKCIETTARVKGLSQL